MSNHILLRIAKNFEAALKEFRPEKYVIIETASEKFTNEGIEAVLNGQMDDIPLMKGHCISYRKSHILNCCVYNMYILKRKAAMISMKVK
jgi:hypothetical protein